MTDYSNFVVPEVLEDIDIDTIHTRMLNQLPPNIDKTEGGFAYDMTRPSAMEKSDIMTIMIEVIKLFFPEWSYGVFLDMLARPCGIRRRDATPAVATLHITGMAGTIIPQGFGFATSGTAISESIFYESMEEATIANNGEVDVMVKCTETGTVGNVPSDCIILMTVPIPAITGVTNLDPATGGTEVEDDETLRNRIMEYDRGRNGSYTGCDAD